MIHFNFSEHLNALASPAYLSISMVTCRRRANVTVIVVRKKMSTRVYLKEKTVC